MENVKAFKRKMLLWTSTWSQEDQQQLTEDVPYTPDAVEIACLLQATGFRMRFMDRSAPKEVHPVPGIPQDNPACRVIIMCPRSGVRMELDAETTSCKCPSPDKSDLGHSWAFGQPISEEMVKAVDSVAPKPGNGISRMVSQLIGGLFQVMSMFPDLNHNDVKGAVGSGVSSKSSIPQARVATSAMYHSDSPMKTPATGITIVTPNAPCVPKASPGDSTTAKVSRYRSLDTLIASDGLRDDLPEPGQLTPKNGGNSRQGMDMEVDGDFDVTLYTTAQNDTNISQDPSASASKKFMSKSSPAVNCAESFQRSDTFTFEDEEEERNPQQNEAKKKKLLRSDTYVTSNSVKKIGEEPRVDHPLQATPSPLDQPSTSQSSVILNKLQEIQLAVSDVIFMIAGNEKNLSNIGDVSKASKAVAGAVQRIITENTVRPIRCLSDFGSVPNLNRAMTIVRSIPRPSMRRSTTAIAAPATPTTSRRGGTNGTDRSKRGSTSKLSKPASTLKISSNKAAGQTGSSLQKIDPSPSSTTSIATGKDKETVYQPSSNFRVVDCDKKYAHAQTSIPKPGSIRK